MKPSLHVLTCSFSLLLRPRSAPLGPHGSLHEQGGQDVGEDEAFEDGEEKHHAWRSKGGSSSGKDPQARGKVLIEKPVRAGALEAALGRIWCPLKGIECKDMGKDIQEKKTWVRIFPVHLSSGIWETEGNEG